MNVDIYENTKLKNFGKESVLDFIQNKIKNSNNVKEDILDKIRYETDVVTDGTYTEDMSSQGFYYERLWDLCIKFGVTDLTLPSIKEKGKEKDPSQKVHLQTSYIINENPNEIEIEFQKNCWAGNKLNEYLRQNVRSGNSGGYSDITFFNKFLDNNKEELYFISVKYFKEEKEISKYDIGKLCALIQNHTKENRNIKIYIFVKDKEKAIAKFDAQHSSSNILIKYINPGGKYEHIYDIKDLQFFYFKLKKLLEQYNYLQTDNISDFEKNYLEVLKSVFIPRFHQELFILKINKLIDEGEKNILVGAIPRSGKSYIMAGTILEYVKKSEAVYPGKKLKFLMMTPAPNETFGEYQAIFNNYIEFDQLGIKIDVYKGDANFKNIYSNKNKHCVIIISKQKLGWKAGSKAEKLLEKDDAIKDVGEYIEVDEDVIENEVDVEVEDVDVNDADKDIKIIKQRVTKLLGANPDINVMFLDEAHFGMSTEKAKKIVEVLNSTISNTIKIYVTATYNKPLQTYGVKSNCKLTWDMNDIKIMQNLTKETINDNPIKQQFGSDIYNEALEYYGDKSGETLIDKLKKEYDVYPKPYLITSLWDKEFLNVEKLKVGETEFGWNMNKLFATIGDSDNFANLEQIKEMMRYYFGYPDKKDNYAEQSFYRTRGILPRIRNICLNKCRTLQPNHKTTQLWFLPLGSGKIKNKIKALITLFTLNEFKDVKQNYHFFVAIDVEDKTKRGNTFDGDNGKNVSVTYMNNPREIKQEIEAVEKKIKDGKIKVDNLIILAGQRLQLGISLRNVDIVTLWNSISSADAIFQMLFRSMTEVDSPPCITNDEYCDQKSFGFMVDMNPERALTNVLLFGENITNKSENDVVQKYRQITDLINIDEDVLLDKYAYDEAGRNKFVADLFNKLYASWNINVKNMQQIISKFSFDMTKLATLKDAFKKIRIDKPKQPEAEDIKGDTEGFDKKKGKDKGKGKDKDKDKEKDKEKDNDKEKEINLNEIATELISEFISLLNIFTLYADEHAKCILTDNKQINNQITLIDDIDALKNKVYNNAEQKELFLKILNGRLLGNSDELYPEQVVDIVLDAMNNANDKQVMNKIIMSQKKHYYTINEPDELLKFIDSQLKPKEKEKKDNGEVFTPLSLVNDMLTKLDEVYTKEHGKSIFTEKGFKWFDPAVGIGNFPIMVYQKLMAGLKPVITDDEERRQHILEHMIYSAELTPKNVFIYKKIFCDDKYKLNIYEGDTLKMDVKKEFDLPIDFQGFDVIMGNPPYQQKVGPNKTETLWDKFIIKSFKLLKSSGYLVYVHPSGWRNIDGKFKNIQKDILTRDLQYLEIHNEKDGLNTFSSETRYDWYVLKNDKVDTTNTIIKFQDGTTNTINVNGLEFIPNGEYEKIMSMIAKNGEENVDVIHDYSLYETRKSWMSRTETKEEYKYPCVYTVNSKSKPSFFYSSKQHGHFGVPKFIWSNGRISSIGSYVDINGDYGLTQFAYAIVDKPENLPKIKEVFDSKEFRNLMELCAVGQLTVNYKVISIFKKDFWVKFLDKIEDKPLSTEAEGIVNIKVPDEDIRVSTLVAEVPEIQIPVLKKKRSLKILPVNSYNPYEIIISKDVDEGEPVEEKPKKIFNPSTNRFVNDTPSNRRKIDKDKDKSKNKNTLKRGGKFKKTIRKNYKINKHRTIKHKNRR